MCSMAVCDARALKYDGSREWFVNTRTHCECHREEDEFKEHGEELFRYNFKWNVLPNVELVGFDTQTHTQRADNTNRTDKMVHVRSFMVPFFTYLATSVNNYDAGDCTNRLP